MRAWGFGFIRPAGINVYLSLPATYPLADADRETDSSVVLLLEIHPSRLKVTVVSSGATVSCCFPYYLPPYHLSYRPARICCRLSLLQAEAAEGERWSDKTAGMAQ